MLFIFLVVASYHFGKEDSLDENNQSVGENELLSKLIELSKSSEGPLIVKDNNQNNVGVLTQSDLLKAVIEGGDGE